MPDLVFGPRAHQVVVVEVIVGVQSEVPVWVGEGALTRVQGAGTQARHPRVRLLTFLPRETLGAVQVCPTGGIIDVNEIPIKGPARLVDAYARAVNQDDLPGDRSLKGQRCDVQLRVGPRHIWMVPRQPRKFCAIGGNRRGLGEVCSAKNGDDRIIIARC